MKQLKHTNVCELKNCFYSKGDKVCKHTVVSVLHKPYILSAFCQPDEVYLNLVLEFVPETIYRIVKHYSRTKRQVPTLYVKVRNFLFSRFRS